MDRFHHFFSASILFQYFPKLFWVYGLLVQVFQPFQKQFWHCQVPPFFPKPFPTIDGLPDNNAPTRYWSLHDRQLLHNPVIDSTCFLRNNAIWSCPVPLEDLFQKPPMPL